MRYTEEYTYKDNKIIVDTDYGDIKHHREYEIINITDLDNLPVTYKVWNISFNAEKNGFKVYVPIVDVNGYNVLTENKMYALDVEREEIQKEVLKYEMYHGYKSLKDLKEELLTVLPSVVG